MKDTDTEEAKRRAEWLNEHRAPKDWLIVTESEISSARTEFSAIEHERDKLQREVDLLKKTPLRQRCQELERLSDHWCDMHTVAAKERDEAREQIKVLRDMIGAAIDNTEELTMYGRDLCRELRQIAVISRIEFDQLKEDTK